MRRLTLKKETVAELTAEDLGAVVAGGTLSVCVCISGVVACPTNYDCNPTIGC